MATMLPTQILTELASSVGAVAIKIVSILFIMMDYM